MGGQNVIIAARALIECNYLGFGPANRAKRADNNSNAVVSIILSSRPLQTVKNVRKGSILNRTTCRSQLVASQKRHFPTRNFWQLVLVLELGGHILASETLLKWLHINKRLFKTIIESRD